MMVIALFSSTEIDILEEEIDKLIEKGVVM